MADSRSGVSRCATRRKPPGMRRRHPVWVAGWLGGEVASGAVRWTDARGSWRGSNEGSGVVVAADVERVGHLEGSDSHISPMS